MSSLLLQHITEPSLLNHFTREMPSESQINCSRTGNSAATPPARDQPHSIFDKRQKGLIVAIVSTAATCKLNRFLSSRQR
jgi:hypothetical protein